MSWENAYWDAIEELYWEPSLLGLKSIPKKYRSQSETHVCIPADALPAGGSLYARPQKAVDNISRLRRLEVPLNHLFDICFSLVPSSVLQSIFLAPLGLVDHGEFERLGREIGSRYDGFADNTATQQDGFFVSPHTLLGIEMKVDAPTSPGQLLKYVALMMAEECFSGRRENLILTFITPELDETRCFDKCKLEVDGTVPAEYLNNLSSSQLRGVVSKSIDNNKDQFQDCLARLRVTHLSWSALSASCEDIATEANDAGGYSVTLGNLMDGMANSIHKNPNTHST